MKKIILALGIVNSLAIIIAVIIISLPQKSLTKTENFNYDTNHSINYPKNDTFKLFDAFTHNQKLLNENKFLIWINIPEFCLRFFYYSTMIDSGMIAAGKHFSPTIDVLANEIAYRPAFSPTESESSRGWKPAPPDRTSYPEKPRNPLGRRRIVLHQSFRMHGTNNEMSLGKPASNGCTRVENLAIERITDTIVNNSLISKHTGNKNAYEIFVLAQPFRIIQCYRLWNYMSLKDSIIYLTVYPDIHNRLEKENFNPSFPWHKDVPGNAYLKEHFINDLALLGIYVDLYDSQTQKEFLNLWDKLKEKIQSTKRIPISTYIEIPCRMTKIISNKY
mgnify:CR=1 FL=1